jgi:hypothetical protein
MNLKPLPGATATLGFSAANQTIAGGSALRICPLPQRASAIGLAENDVRRVET